MKVRSKRAPRVQVAAWCWLGLLIFGIAAASAQDTNRETSLRSDILKRAQSAAPSLSATAYEGVLDRDAYLLGPGDKLILQIWSPSYEELPAVVSGEGRIAVPFAGPVKVAGLTLADAEAAVSREFDTALRRGRISISLLEPRQFRVHVTGQVVMPGTVTVPATARVADAIAQAGGTKRTYQIAGADSVFTPLAALREIELRSAVTGDVTPVDLQSFFSGGSLAANPYVTDGATIYVPPRSAGQTVGIFGEVRMPGIYDYFSGDNVGSLIALAGGLTALADSNLVTLQHAEGAATKVNFSLSSLATPVKPGERVFVGGVPRDVLHGSVTVGGQVARPGGYAIVPGKTTVAELLEQAGGYLPQASAQSARLERKGDERLAEERGRLSRIPMKTGTKDDPTMLADQEMAAEFARWTYGTVVLDLTAEAGEPGYAGDVVLMDGDQLDVPAQPLGVRVLGYVNHAGEVPWQDGADLNHYVAMAGGKNRAGWLGRSVILKVRNGSQLRYSQQVTVDPGDVLFIPQRPRTTGWERVKDILTVVAQLATVVLVVDTATK